MEVIADLPQVTQQRPLPQRREKPRPAQRPQRALHAARRPHRQRPRIRGDHRRIGAGRLPPPRREQILLELIQILRPDQRVPARQVPARQAEQVPIEGTPHLRLRQPAARQAHPTAQRRSPRLREACSPSHAADRPHAHTPPAPRHPSLPVPPYEDPTHSQPQAPLPRPAGRGHERPSVRLTHGGPGDNPLYHPPEFRRCESGTVPTGRPPSAGYCVLPPVVYRLDDPAWFDRQDLACDEDSCRILSQLIRSGRSPVAGGRLVVR